MCPLQTPVPVAFCMVEKGVDNLLWAFAPNKPFFNKAAYGVDTTEESWYPGDVAAYRNF